MLPGTNLMRAEREKMTSLGAKRQQFVPRGIRARRPLYPGMMRPTREKHGQEEYNCYGAAHQRGDTTAGMHVVQHRSM